MRCFLFVLLLSACAAPLPDDSLILAVGRSGNPAEPRVAMEITPNTLYYGVEKMNPEHTGVYMCYWRKFDLDSFNLYKNRIKETFKADFTENDVADATEYVLVLKENGKETIRKRFVDAFLNEEERLFLQEIQNLDKRNLNVSSHIIMESILNEELPKPPLPPSDKYPEK